MGFSTNLFGQCSGCSSRTVNGGNEPQEQSNARHEAANMMAYGIQEYQKNWSKEYKETADMLFVVEGHSLPVHSGILNDSDYLRERSRPGRKAGIVKVEKIFLGLKLEDMLEFLRFVYHIDDEQPISRISGVLEISRRIRSLSITAQLEKLTARKPGKKTKRATKLGVKVAKHVAEAAVKAAVGVAAFLICGLPPP